MRPLRYTLVGDGPADSALAPIIDWMIERRPAIATRGFTRQFADPRALPLQGKGLAEKLRAAVRHYPCDVLFVHRDAEREPREARIEEVRKACHEIGDPPNIPVVPVRMTEAWLLIDAVAIRRAADNPNGACRLRLPAINELESQPDPKELLHTLLIEASELTGRRRNKFMLGLARRHHRVAELIGDFSPLRRLPAFAAFEAEAELVLSRLTPSL